MSAPGSERVESFPHQLPHSRPLHVESPVSRVRVRVSMVHGEVNIGLNWRRRPGCFGLAIVKRVGT